MPKKKQKLEYRVYVFPIYDEGSRKRSTLFRLETVEEFSAFQYEIAVEEKTADRRIEWKIRGLRSPAVTLPGTGPATFTKDYESLKGQYEFALRKLDGRENIFTLEIGEQRVSVLKAPRERFVEVLTPTEKLTTAS